MTSAKFEIPRHNDPTYDAPEPWNHWDTYAGCWTCSRCGAAAGYQLHNPGCAAVPHADADVACSCYGCEIKRARAGLRPPARAAEPCEPPGACASHGRCWTHSEWIDEAACDPPSACARRLACGSHGKAIA